MMHGYRFLLYYLWIAPHILLALVAIVMRVKRLDVSFPLFAIYTWYEVAEFVLLFAIAVTKLIQGMLYMRVFLVTLAVSTALRFGILQEIFNNVFREHGRADAIARVLLRWTTGILLAAAISCAIFAPGPTSSSLIAATAWLGRGIAISVFCRPWNSPTGQCVVETSRNPLAKRLTCLQPGAITLLCCSGSLT